MNNLKEDLYEVKRKPRTRESKLLSLIFIPKAVGTHASVSVGDRNLLISPGGIFKLTSLFAPFRIWAWAGGSGPKRQAWNELNKPRKHEWKDLRLGPGRTSDRVERIDKPEDLLSEFVLILEEIEAEEEPEGLASKSGREVDEGLCHC